MKKILFALAIIAVLFGCNRHSYKSGSRDISPTTGTWLKRGLIVGTTDSTAVIDSITKNGDVLKFYVGGSSRSTIEASEYGIALVDSDLYVTPYKISQTKYDFIVGAIGAPDEGDSTITRSQFVGMAAIITRDGAELIYSATPTNAYAHFRLNTTTGTITVHPPFVQGEAVIIRVFDPTIIIDIN